MTMPKLLLAAATAALVVLSGCDQTTDSAEVKKLRAEVDALKIAVYGDPLTTCYEDKVIEDISAYASTLEGLPDSELEPEVWHTSNGARGGVTTTDSGLQYTVVQEGDPKAHSPEGGQIIKVNYHGIFTNGEKFDSAYDRGAPAEFPANRVIAGWVEALGDMKVCEARTLYIPGKLAYGEKGREGAIPPNATLIFHVQLLGIEK